jgi:hypothetical protein
MPTLIYQKTGQPVNVGDVIHSRPGRYCLRLDGAPTPCQRTAYQVQTMDERQLEP